jgi:hypothetical protein
MDKWGMLGEILIKSYASPAVVNFSEDKVLILGGRSDNWGHDITLFNHDTRVIKRFKAKVQAERLDYISN